MATAYPGGLRKRGGLLDNEDTIQATPRNPFFGGVADLLGQAYKLPEMPRLGVPGMDFMAVNRNRLMDLLGVGDVQKTAEALSYGNRLGTGTGITYRPLPETVGAALTVAPFAGKAIRATERLPVGASIKLVDDAAIFKDASVLINPKNLKPLNKVEDVEKYKTIVNSMEKSGYQGRPILAYMDKGKAKALTGSHRIFAAREAGIDVPVVFVNPSVMKWEDKSGLFGTFKESIKDQRVYNYLKAAGDDVAASLSKLEDSVVQPSMSPYPQAEALRLAQQRAALPVEQGGLGLLESNTAMDRAKAMGGKDMVHFSRGGGDYATLDSGKFAIAPFDAVGTHVGTPGAAMERFQNTTGYKVNNPNYANDELKGVTYPVTILGDRPMMNQNGMPFGEDDLNALLRQQGGHNWSDIQGGKMTYQDMNAGLRKKLFEDQGYTSIPYYNEVEGKGSVSYIVPPENIRSRFAAFDPFRRTAATAAAMGVAAPDLLAAETPEEMKRRQLRGLLAP